VTDYETYVRGLLADIYTDQGVEVWLNAPHRLLGDQRPIDILDVEPERVLQVIFQLLDGAYV
jgi:uncharacterized protein (DUF2384 family)